jgi:multiple sugar transport system substrate-binding protein
MQSLTPYSLQSTQLSSQAVNSNEQNEVQDELTIWSYYDMSYSDQAFESNHPGVKLHSTQFEYNEVVATYIKAFLTGEAPDIVIFDSSQFSHFNGINTLEDLSSEAYDSKEYLDKIPQSLIPMFSSFDQKKLIAIPAEITSAVTFYRADLLEDNGFPSDPDELATYLESPTNLIHMAKELKKQNIFIFQYYTEPFDIVSSGFSMFNKNLEYNRSGQDFENALYTAKEIRKFGLALNSSVWDTTGQEALRDGHLALMFTGSWGVGNLMNWTPELEGKWRATALPLGISGYLGGAEVGIVNTSKNKDLAWEYIQTITNVLNPSMNKSNQQYLGGQDLIPLIDQNFNQPISLFPSPIDNEITDIWNKRINMMIQSDDPDIELLKQTGEYIELITEDDRSLLKRFIQP